jgi:hypothetical protein
MHNFTADGRRGDNSAKAGIGVDGSSTDLFIEEI